MRWKLLRRRLTVSAPRMAVRSRLPWPLRWARVAVALGVCAALGLWAFESGRSLAGIEAGGREALLRLRGEAQRLRRERDQAQAVADSAASLLTAEKAAQDRLAAQVRALEQENRALRDDLGFFQALIPASGDGIAIRALQAEVITGNRLRWRVLAINPARNAPEFRGHLELTLGGTQGGRPWRMALPGGPQALEFRQYRRVEGICDLPPQAMVKNVSARLLEGTAIRASQTVEL